MHTSWKAANADTRPCGTAQSCRWGGVQTGAWRGGSRRPVSGWGGAGRRGREEGPGVESWQESRGRAGDRREGAGGVRARGLPGGGSPEARLLPGAGRHRRRGGGAEPARSCHPAAGLGRRHPPAAGHAPRALSPNNAPRRSAGRLAARRPAARPGERGPEVSLRTPSPNSASFCLADVAAEGAFGERRDRGRATPCRRPLG